MQGFRAYGDGSNGERITRLGLKICRLRLDQIVCKEPDATWLDTDISLGDENARHMENEPSDLERRKLRFSDARCVMLISGKVG
jgi:hypothetical protein